MARTLFSVLASTLIAALALSAHAQTSGREVTCRDFRNGADITIRAQQLALDGSVDGAWDPATSGLCVGAGTDLSFGSVRDGQGGAYVAWIEPNGKGTNLRVQRMDANGNVRAGWPVAGVLVCGADGDQYAARITTDGAGGVYVVWQDYRAGQGDIYLSRLSPTGAPAQGWPTNGIAVCADSAEQSGPIVVPNAAGGAIVLWQDYRSGVSRLRSSQVSAGASLPAEGSVGLATGGVAQGNMQAVGDGGGGAYVAWEETDGAGGYRARLGRLDSAGHPLANWPAAGVALSTATGVQRFPILALTSGGGASVAWYARGSAAGEIRVQQVDGAGALRGGWPAEGIELAPGPGEQYAAAIVADSSGGAYVAWEDYRAGALGDVFAQHVGAQGARLWAASGAVVCDDPADQTSPVVSLAPLGGLRVSWTDDRSSSHGEWAASAAPVFELASVEVGADGVHFVWHTPGGTGLAHLYRAGDSGSWRRVASATVTSGDVAIVDADPSAEAHARYRLAVYVRGREIRTPEVTVDASARLVLTLERVQPSPARGAFRVMFTLPSASHAMLELIDIAGRRIASRSVGELGAGRHSIELTEARTVPPGHYILRLIQNGHALTSPVTVLR
jgi:hypothetical protein